MSVGLPQLTMTVPNTEETNPTRALPETSLTFPEVEELLAKDGKLVAKGKQAGPTLAGVAARKNFSRMAFKVLSQIIDSSDKPPEDKDTARGTSGKVNKPQAEKPPNLSDATSRALQRSKCNLSLSGSTASLAADSSRGSQEPGTPRRKKPSFMSLVKLATLKKKLSRKNGSTNSMDKIEEEVGLPTLPVPDKPRFCATLSPEAQYAMMKCYEDVLLDNLKSETILNTNGVLYRVKTPHLRVHAVQLAGLIPPVSLEDHLPSISTLKPPAPGINPMQVAASTLDKTRPEGTQAAVCKERQLAAASKERQLAAASKERQLRLSYRFQTAMDILDQLRQSHGELVISPRIEQYKLHPSRNYNLWSKAWSQDFQFDVGQGKQAR